MDSEDKVYVLGSKHHPDMKPLRVYFFNQEDVFMDFELNMKQTTVGAFIKFVINSFQSNPKMN